MEEIERMRRTAERQLEATKAMRAAIARSIFESEEASDWEQEKLKDICTLITDGTHFTPNYVSHGIPFLSVKDVRETGISFANTRFISHSEHAELIKRCHPKKGDVLYTKVGTTGIAKAIDFEREFSVFVSLALLRPNPDKVLPEYLEYVLNSPTGREQAEKMTQGIGNQNLVLEDLENIELPIAPPALQLDIVKKLRESLAEADFRITIAERSLEAINALPGAFLRQVFGLFEPPEPDELPDILNDETEELEDEEEE
jgi:type I restriction enzyme S subunit